MRYNLGSRILNLAEQIEVLTLKIKFCAFKSRLPRHHLVLAASIVQVAILPGLYIIYFHHYVVVVSLDFDFTAYLLTGEAALTKSAARSAA